MKNEFLIDLAIYKVFTDKRNTNDKYVMTMDEVDKFNKIIEPHKRDKSSVGDEKMIKALLLTKEQVQPDVCKYILSNEVFVDFPVNQMRWELIKVSKQQ